MFPRKKSAFFMIPQGKGAVNEKLSRLFSEKSKKIKKTLVISRGIRYNRKAVESHTVRWAFSSVGQSIRLITGRSRVQVPEGPPLFRHKFIPFLDGRPYLEKSRSWSSAHDWKSCRPHKGLESSNLSFSAKSPVIPGIAGLFLFWKTGKKRRCSNKRSSMRSVRPFISCEILPLSPQPGKDVEKSP